MHNVQNILIKYAYLGEIGKFMRYINWAIGVTFDKNLDYNILF